MAGAGVCTHLSGAHGKLLLPVISLSDPFLSGATEGEKQIPCGKGYDCVGDNERKEARWEA